MSAEDANTWFRDTKRYRIEAGTEHGDHHLRVRYNAEYESFYCEQCDVWLSETCPDPQCGFCSLRPTKPSHKMTGP